MGTNVQMSGLKREDLVYPELSYQLLGLLFDVHNQLGHGFAESVYQKAFAEALTKAQIKFQEQVYAPVSYLDKKIASGYLDFLIDDKIIIELKKGDRFLKVHIDQVYQYLLSKKLKLGILVYFAPRKLHYKRILNINS